MGGLSPRFKYLPYDLAMLLSLFFASVAISIYFQRKYPSYVSFRFESTFVTSFSSSPTMVRVLLTVRVIFFLFFLVASGSVNWAFYTNDDKAFKYFTNWNVGLIFFYYLNVSTCSLLGTIYPFAGGVIGEKEAWSWYIRWYGECVHALFEVAGSCAFFITFVDFCFLSDQLVYTNTTIHLCTTLSFLVEMMLNGFLVHYSHMPLLLGWAVLFTIASTCMVTTGFIHDWPYFFQHADTPVSVVWYAVLLLAACLFYSIWYGLSRLKLWLLPELNDAQRMFSRDIDFNGDEDHSRLLKIGLMNNQDMDNEKF